MKWPAEKLKNGRLKPLVLIRDNLETNTKWDPACDGSFSEIKEGGNVEVEREFTNFEPAMKAGDDRVR
jgi:hypothetical protein